MLTAALLAVLGAAEASSDVRPRAPGTPQAPAVRALFPQDEDWSAAGENAPAFQAQSWGVDHATTTSIGVDARLHYEHFQNEAFGALPGSDDAIFLLITPWVSATYNDRVRVYGALKHASVEGRDGPKPGAISDTIDLHQGFVELALGDAVGQSRKDLLVRAGRQELHYGAGRLIAVRGGRFIRDDYDGALIRYRHGQWITDAFGFYGVQDGKNAFDNGTDDSASLSGIYSSGTLQDTNIDLYGVRWQRDRVGRSAGLSESVRNFAGARLAGTAFDYWTWDVEATVQFGSVEATDEDISGFQIGGRIARSLSKVPGSPTPTVEFLYSTGDDNPNDEKVETFLAPAASGLVYEDVTQPLGPGNLAWVKGSVPFQIGERLRVSPYAHAYWRVESEDALYTLFNTQLVAPNSGDGDFVGLDIGVTARLNLTDRLAAIAYGSHFDPGSVFTSTGRKAVGTSTMLGLTYRY